MTDAKKREKIIARLQDVSVLCAGNGEIQTMRTLDDAIALLKEQEPVKPFGGYGFYFCGGCKNPFNSVSQKFCSECGKAVKWDD